MTEAEPPPPPPPPPKKSGQPLAVCGSEVKGAGSEMIRERYRAESFLFVERAHDCAPVTKHTALEMVVRIPAIVLLQVILVTTQGKYNA